MSILRFFAPFSGLPFAPDFKSESDFDLTTTDWEELGLVSSVEGSKALSSVSSRSRIVGRTKFIRSALLGLCHRSSLTKGASQ